MNHIAQHEYWPMPKLSVACFSISLDGYGAGPNQDKDNPLGVGGTALHSWFYATRTFQKMFGKDDGATGIDDDFAARGMTNLALGFLAGTCSAQSAVLGRMITGRAGGAQTLRITFLFSC